VNNIVCSVAIEPHVSSGPGLDVCGAEDVFHEDVRVEESTQPSTTNPSCKQEVVCKTEDSQMLLQTQPTSKPRIVESERRDVRTNTQGLVIERVLDIVDILRKGKWSRPPDVNSSMIVKNNISRYSELSSSFVRSDAQVTKKLENLVIGRDSLSEDVGDAIHAGKRGRPPDIEQVLLRNDKCCYSGILKGNVHRTEYGTHTALKVENSTRKLNHACKRDIVCKLHEKWKLYVPSTNVVAKRAHAEMLGCWYDNLEVYSTSTIVRSIDRYNIKTLRDSPHQDKATLMGSLVCFARLRSKRGKGGSTKRLHLRDKNLLPKHINNCTTAQFTLYVAILKCDGPTEQTDIIIRQCSYHGHLPMLALIPLTLENPRWHWTRIVSQFETSSTVAAQLVLFEMVLMSHSYHYLWKSGCEIMWLENDSRRSAVHAQEPQEMCYASRLIRSAKASEDDLHQDQMIMTRNLICLAVVQGKRGEDGSHSVKQLCPSRNQKLSKQNSVHSVTALYTLYLTIQANGMDYSPYRPGHEPLMLKNDSGRSTPMQRLLLQKTSLTSMSLQLVDR
jgi:hypothetical protein